MTDPGTKPTPAELYERVFVPAIFAPLARVLVDAAAPQPGEAVLDVACGTGIVARTAAAAVGANGSVVGLDLRPGMLAVARGTSVDDGPPIDWVEADAAALPFEDGRFDLVLCQQGLQFFDQRDAALREMRRVLRHGGRLAAAVWRGFEEQPLYRDLADVEVRHLAGTGLGPDDVAFPFLWGDPATIEATVRGAGFDDVTVETATIDTEFVAAGFVADIEYAYQAVVPMFQEQPDRYDAFIAGVERDARPILERYRSGDRIRAPMRTNIVTAARPS